MRAGRLRANRGADFGAGCHWRGASLASALGKHWRLKAAASGTRRGEDAGAKAASQPPKLTRSVSEGVGCPAWNRPRSRLGLVFAHASGWFFWFPSSGLGLAIEGKAELQRQAFPSRSWGTRNVGPPGVRHRKLRGNWAFGRGAGAKDALKRSRLGRRRPSELWTAPVWDTNGRKWSGTLPFRTHWHARSVKRLPFGTQTGVGALERSRLGRRRPSLLWTAPV